MANKLTFEVEIVQKGGKQVIQLVQGVAQATQKATAATQQHTTAQQINTQTQAKGVIGTANSSKNFSKLAETIGSGGNGLVGAYATLAANIFAVSAAFNALRSASQVQQVLAGIEAMGARTGRTTTLAASSIKELTNNAISSEQALRSTAQVFAAGFGQKELEQLTQVALDASSALGRNLPDSMDRITRGVIKLEPELLDELGLMTRLDEATQSYAVTLGKSASQLTATEKRIGFLNAIVEEGTLKMGGLAESGDQFKSFDRLAATFSDLTNKVIGFVAKAITPLVEIVANNMGVLTGLVIMFAGTISRDLLPGLNNLATKAKESAVALAKTSEATAKTIGVIKNGPQVFNDLQKKIQDGTATTNDYARAQISLRRSIESTLRAQEKAKAAGTPVAAGSDLRIAQAREAQKAIADVVRTQQQSAAAGKAATAVELASQGNIKSAYEAGRAAVIEFKNAETAATKQSISNLARLRIAAFAAATAVRAVGAAFLYAIPIIGQVALAVSLLVSVFDYIKDALTTDEWKEYNKLSKQFTEIVDALDEKTAAYVRTLDSLGQGSQKQIQLLTIESNTISEIGSKYLELTEAKKRASVAETDYGNALFNTIASIIKAGDNLDKKLTNKIEELITGVNSDSPLFEFRYSLMPVSGTEEFKAYSAILQSEMPTAVKMLKKEFDITSEAAKGLTPIEKQKKMGEAVEKVSESMKDMSAVMQNIVVVFKELDTAASQFIKSLSISTAFDDIVIKSGAARDQILELQRVIATSEFTTQELAGSVANLGSSYAKFLSPKIKKAITDFNAYSAAAARAKKQGKLEESNRNTKEAERAAETIYRFGLAEIAVVDKKFRIAQESARLNKSEIDILKARLAANKELYSISVSGLQAQFQMETEITKKEIEGLRIQKQAVDDVLRTSSVFSEAQRKELEEKTRIAAELAAQGKKVDADTIARIQELSAAEKDIADNKAAQLNLDNQILVKNISIKNQAEVTAYLYERQLGLLNKVLAIQSNIATLSKEEISNRLKLDRIIVGRPEFISDKLKELKIQKEINKSQLSFSFQQEQNNLKARRAVAVASLSRALTNLERTAALETVAIIDKEIDLTNERYRLQSKNLELTSMQNSLAEVTFDSRVQGIEWQKEGLSLFEKEIAARKTTLEQTDEIATLQKQIALNNSGLSFNDNQQKASAIEVATTAYKLAVEESQLKKDLITLEFGLLRAQREYLAIELKTRRTQIATSTEFKTDEQKAAQKAMLSSLDTTLSILGNDTKLFDSVLEASLTSIDKSVEAQRLRLQAVSNIIPNLNTPISAVRQAFADGASLTKALGKRNEALVSAPPVTRMLENAIPIAEEIGRAIADPLESVLEKSMTPIEKSYKDIIQIGKEIQATGLRVSEHPAFGGVGKHTPNSSHYTGNAIDVNMGRGINEYNDPAARKKFEAMADKYISTGAKVLFGPVGSKYNNSKYDHTDHMHITFRPEDARKSGVVIAEAFNEEIVVSAPKIASSSTLSKDYIASLTPDLQGFNNQALEQKIELSKGILNPFVEQLKQLGPEGELVSSAITGIYSIQSSAFRLADTLSKTFETSSQKTATTISMALEVGQAAASTINSIVQQQAAIKTAAIDKEIEAEKKRDGKSSESVAKIAALEKRKDQIAKKAFDTNKKMMAAQAVMSTASGIAMALGTMPFPASAVIAGAIAAMGAAQLAVISSQKYEGSGAQAPTVGTPSSLSIGTRSSSVDIARSNASAGGEYGYTAGFRGFGKNAQSFSTIGSSYGGDFGRGYGNNAFAIGEKGPEIMTRDTPVEITPIEKEMNTQPVNANFYIQALDSDGVEQVLSKNKGALIEAIRAAANSGGKTFLEDINTNSLKVGMGTKI